MTKDKKCIERNCGDEARYCSSHYMKEINKSSDRGFAILILSLFFIGIILGMPALLLGNVDEDTFCFNKLNKYFPEYNFESADYFYDTNGRHTCTGIYQEERVGETRDGLSDVTNKAMTLKKVYKLTSEKDIKFLNRDNGSNLLAGIGACFWFISGFILFMYIKELR